MAKRVTITVNGGKHAVEATADTPLLYVLRNELKLHGPRFGCGLAECGACTVIVNGKTVRSCITPVEQVANQKVTTLEGLGTEEKPAPIQEAFVAEQAAQCGYCTNGMMMAATVLLKENPNPTEAEIKSAMTPWLCRCGTHFRIVRAIQRAAKEKA